MKDITTVLWGTTTVQSPRLHTKQSKVNRKRAKKWKDNFIVSSYRVMTVQCRRCLISGPVCLWHSSHYRFCKVFVVSIRRRRLSQETVGTSWHRNQSRKWKGPGHPVTVGQFCFQADDAVGTRGHKILTGLLLGMSYLCTQSSCFLSNSLQRSTSSYDIIAFLLHLGVSLFWSHWRT
jgi:hypothetical protein